MKKPGKGKQDSHSTGIRNRITAVSLTLAVTLTILLAFADSAAAIGRVAGSAALLSAKLTVPQGGTELMTENFSAIASLLAPVREAAGSSSSAASSSSAVSSSSPASSAASSQSASSAAQESSSSGTVPSGMKSVKTVQFGSQSTGDYSLFNGICVCNQTAHHQPDIQKELAIRPDIKIDLKSAPQVLILHTHTTESFASADQNWYDPNGATRNPDKTKSVVRVGDEITSYLEKSGIGVLHDTTYHDYPDYEGAYDRELATIQSDLKKYPSIKIVLDIHRDCIQYSDGSRAKPTAVVDGKKAAQIMIEAPCDEPGLSPSVPNWEQNYRFGLRIQQQLVQDYPGLARPLDLRNRRYNMHMSNGSLLVEFGTDVNTLDEAVYAGQLFGQSLAKVLLSLQ